MFIKDFLFWQPKQSLFKILCKSKAGTFLLVASNYLIWFLLAFLSLRLATKDANIFWQLFLSTLIAEAIERFSKTFLFWSRPICKHKYTLPKGLVKNWYNTGSFPSGHTSKAVFFLLYIIQYSLFDRHLFLLLTTPLLLFRVLVGFHYPIDILGGIVVGCGAWMIVHGVNFPQSLITLVEPIFSIFTP